MAGTVTKTPVRKRTLSQLRRLHVIAAMRPYGPERVKKLTGKAALVTGGAVRVGRAIALALAREGADVAIAYLRSGVAAKTTVRDLHALGVRAGAFRADLAKPAEARRLVTRAV